MKFRTGLIIAATAGILLAVLALRPQPIEVETSAVRRGELEERIENEGRTRVRDRYEVRAPLEGILGRIPVEAGDPVRAGETLLAAIEPPAARLLDPRAEEEARSRIGAAEAGVEEAGHRLSQAEEIRRLAETEFARLRDLVRAGDAAARDRDLAEQELRRAEGESRRAAAAVAISEHELGVARAAFARAFPAAADGAGAGGDEGGGGARALRILSPIDGSVLRVHRESEGPVAAGEPILELGDTRDLEIVADYLTTDAVRIAPGMPARIHGWGGAAPLRARVRRVEPSGRTEISALGVEEQRVDVVLDIEPAEAATADAPPLGDGFRVEVGVVAWRGEDVLIVPEGALFRDGGEWAVFREEAGRAALTPVRVGHRDGRSAEILEGLREGETVIVHPPDAVVDGARVRPTRRE